MTEKRPLWPEQYANRKVQEHEEKIVALEAQIAALTKLVIKPKRKAAPKAAPKD